MITHNTCCTASKPSLVIKTEARRPELERALDAQKRQREASAPLVPFLDVLQMPRRRQNAMLCRRGDHTPAQQRAARAEIRRLTLKGPRFQL